MAVNFNRINQNIQKNEAQKSNIDKQRANLNLNLSTLGQKHQDNNMQQELKSLTRFKILQKY